MILGQALIYRAADLFYRTREGTVRAGAEDFDGNDDDAQNGAQHKGILDHRRTLVPAKKS